MKKIIGILQLLRPANIVTAVADVWAGFAISGAVLLTFQHIHLQTDITRLILLTVSVMALYGAGTVLNDYFDLVTDRTVKPVDRLASRVISKRTSLILSFMLFIAGIVLAFFAGYISGIIAVILAFLTIFYNVYGKYNALTAPISMGLCRGLNLLLGISLVPREIGFNYIIVLIPIVFIAAITSVSRYEGYAGKRTVIQLAGWLYFLVICYLLTFSFINHNFFVALPFIAILFYLIFKPISLAFREPTPDNVSKAVRSGIFSLIVLNAALAASFNGLIAGLIILLLLPLTVALSKHFAMT